MQIHPVAELFPMLADDELRELADDIKINGLQQPIVMFGEELLDGRNRLAACRLVGVDPRFTQYTGDSPVSFIIGVNLRRRHLTIGQKVALALEIEPFYAAEAKKRMLAGVKADPKGQCHLGSEGQSRDLAAAAVGLSGKTVSQAKAIKAESPETFERVKQGLVTIHAAKKELRAAEIANQRAEIAKAAATLSGSDKWSVFTGDVATWQTEKRFDFIITDPPYPKEFLHLYETLALRSNEWLKDGGLLVAMCGQSYLDEIYAMMSKHLRYYWTACYLLPGQPTPLRQVNVNTTWKPLLLFAKGDYRGKIFGDVFRSEANDKDFHKWGQSESGMLDIVSRLAVPGQSILDPFCGAGTTGVAAIRHGCTFVGVDIDEQNRNIAASRIDNALL